jgi:diguanylate cyclase (GGDEF)-like protein/PAS domain S-box-containing protein
MKSRLLLVEDEAFIALEIRDRLQDMGYEVCDMAASGPDALQKVGTLRPDLVLMDINLTGGMSGIEAAVRVREEFDIPVVYLTAHADEEILEQARKTEPYGYLLKPFQDRELRVCIEMALHKHAMERQIRENEEKFRLVTESIKDVFWLKSLDLTQLFYVNPAYETIWGRTCESLYGNPRSFLDSVHPDDQDHVLTALTDNPEKGMEIEYRLLGDDGSVRWIKDRRFPVSDGQGRPSRLAGIATDITEQKVAQEKLLELNRQLERQATQDPLTGLPNRRLFIDRLEQALAHARRFGGRVGMLFVDLDGFKHINDRYGHQAGDQLLRLVARRLQSALRKVDTAARLGGDEFGVVLPDLATGRDAEVVAGKINYEISRPFTLQEVTCQVGASIGISFYPEHGCSADELISRADKTMYLVKQDGKGGCRVFTSPQNVV